MASVNSRYEVNNKSIDPPELSKLSKRIFEARRFSNGSIIAKDDIRLQTQINISSSLKQKTKDQSNLFKPSLVPPQDTQVNSLIKNNTNIYSMIKRQKSKLQQITEGERMGKSNVGTANGIRMQNAQYQMNRPMATPPKNQPSLKASIHQEQKVKVAKAESALKLKAMIRPPARNLTQSKPLAFQDAKPHSMELKNNSTGFSSQNYSTNSTQQKINVYFLPSLIKAFMNPKKLEPALANEFKQYGHSLMKSLMFSGRIDSLNTRLIENKKVTLGPLPRGVKKTLIFDLDETLIHCSQNQKMEFDHIITINIADAGTTKAGLNIRPYAVEAIKELRKHYEIVVFTASHQCYADSILKVFCDGQSLIDHCFYRGHCVVLNNKIHIKSLSIFQDRQLQNMIIIDNNLYSFAYDINNGLPILPFYDNKSDTQLKELKHFLLSISHKINFSKVLRYIYQFDNYINEATLRKTIEKMHINYKSINTLLLL